MFRVPDQEPTMYSFRVTTQSGSVAIGSLKWNINRDETVQRYVQANVEPSKEHGIIKAALQMSTPVVMEIKHEVDNELPAPSGVALEWTLGDASIDSPDDPEFINRRWSLVSMLWEATPLLADSGRCAAEKTCVACGVISGCTWCPGNGTSAGTCVTESQKLDVCDGADAGVRGTASCPACSDLTDCYSCVE
jgi:hypothetical protein